MAGRFIGVSGVTTAMLGISAMLIFGILTWKDVLAYGPAWDTLFWFAILIGMATNLDKQGVIKYFADGLATKINSMGLGMLAVSRPRCPLCPFYLLLPSSVASPHLFSA